MQKLQKEDLTHVGSGSFLREGELGKLVDKHMGIIYDMLMDDPECTIKQLAAGAGCTHTRAASLVGVHFIEVRRAIRPKRIDDSQMVEGFILPHTFKKGKITNMCMHRVVTKRFYTPRLLLDPRSIIALEDSHAILQDRRADRKRIKKGEL